MVYDWIITNKELLKIIYVLVLTFICSIIVLKTDRLFKLSDYQGLRYFRNAFFFYGIAFVFRYILGSRTLSSAPESFFLVIHLIFKFLIITAGLLLLYSLLWKKLEHKKKYHSIFNLNMLVIYLISFAITILDFTWKNDLFFYIFQILLFSLLIIISYTNYSKEGKNYPFLKYYLLTMILGLLTWTLNLFLFVFLDWNKLVQIFVYGLNLIFFLLFLYGVTRMGIKKND